MKHFILIGISILLVVQSCSKPDDLPVQQKDPGLVSGKIDGNGWEPVKYKATYYPKWSQVVITADYPDYPAPESYKFYNLTFGVNIDSLNPLKSYSLVPHGDNNALLYNPQGFFLTDQNEADAGGNFSLLKLDTLNRKLSCRMDFIAYSTNRSKKLSFTQGEFIDITLVVDQQDNPGEYMECSITGVNNTRWKAKDFQIKAVTCSWGNGTGKRITVEAVSIVGQRLLTFQIPLNNGVGNFPLYPTLAPYSFCSNLAITSTYNMNNSESTYFVTSGTINISELDILGKKLKATFNGTYKDTLRQEVLEITNGLLNINDWRDQ